MPPTTLVIRRLGQRDYTPVWHAMQRYTQQRDDASPDELWCVEHPPVFTLGLNGKPHHVLAPGAIPVVNVDRGGQVTYHGPGQAIVYALMNLKRRKLGVRAMVEALEQAVIVLLADYGIEARGRRDAPGVYVEDRKIAALGLRVRRGCSYHGVALNVAMDLTPYQCINPCGYPGMAVTHMAAFTTPPAASDVAQTLAAKLAAALGHTDINFNDKLTL